MSALKRSSYPPEYTRLFERAAKSAIRLYCSTYREAHNLRNQLYSFRKAIILDRQGSAEFREAINRVGFSIETDASGETDKIYLVAGPQESSTLHRQMMISEALSKIEEVDL